MSHTIVLTKNYSFWGEVDIKRVVSWLLKGKIEIIKVDESKELCSSDPKNTHMIKIKWPLIVRLLDFIGYKIKKDKIEWSENAVFLRDDGFCQYVHYDENGKPFKYYCEESDRTIDHIIPISRGGERKSFTNTITSCKNCNIRLKRNKTPDEAGLKLIRQPTEPKFKKGDIMVIKFHYNPNKLSHRAFKELFGL